MGEYLTTKMIEKASSTDFDKESATTAFKKTFDILAQTTKDNSFKRFDKDKDKFVGGFLITPFEVIALGIGFNQPVSFELDQCDPLIKKFWNEDLVSLTTGSGVRASTRIPETVPYGRNLFRK